MEKERRVVPPANIRRECLIESVGRQRNGNSRYWCTVHRAPATGRYGRRLVECESAYLDGGDGDVREIDPADFPGGVALWGAVEPVYNSSGHAADRGIHVHARIEPNGQKVIDQSFAEVRLPYNRDLIESRFAAVTRETGVAYYISRFLDRPMSTLYCVYCGEAHLDADWFAVKPHRRHLCHACGRMFAADRGISNPVMALRHHYRDDRRELVRASRVLDARQQEYAGGFQIWASNPAILWTAKTPEKEGIHVHAYGGPDGYEDDTFDRVILDGVELNEEQLRLFMAQKTLTYLADKVVSINCPSCDSPHCDTGEEAFLPHKDHICHKCGAGFETPGRRKLVVANPFGDTIAELKRLALN